MKIINLLGNEYQGTIGKSVTASKWKGRNYLKKWFKPTNPRSTKQVIVRNLMAAGNGVWQGLLAREKSAYYWYQRYRKTNISPFNAFMGSYIGIEHASPGTYVPPPGVSIQAFSAGPLPVVGAEVYVKKAGQATMYLRGTTDSAGDTLQMGAAEDQNYDLLITHPGWTDYVLLNTTALLLNASHTMV